MNHVNSFSSRMKFMQYQQDPFKSPQYSQINDEDKLMCFNFIEKKMCISFNRKNKSRINIFFNLKFVPILYWKKYIKIMHNILRFCPYLKVLNFERKKFDSSSKNLFVQVCCEFLSLRKKIEKRQLCIKQVRC